jgi:hypothetical protein
MLHQTVWKWQDRIFESQTYYNINLNLADWDITWYPSEKSIPKLLPSSVQAPAQLD